MRKKPKELLTLADLTPDSKNANLGTARGTGMLEKSLREYGAGRSVLVDSQGRIIAGNKSVESAAGIGMEDCIVVQSDGTKLVVVQRTDLDLKDKRAKALAIADNRISEANLNWDVNILSELIADGIDLSQMWRPDELEALLASVLGEPESGILPGADVDEIPENVPTRCKKGDLWALGEHRLLCGDSTDDIDVDRLMGGKKAQAVLIDPPYGISQPGVNNDEPEDNNALVNGIVSRLPVKDSIIVAFQSTRTFPTWLDAIRDAGHTFERMLWMYKAAQCTFPWRGWILKSESILVSSVGKPEWQEVHPFAHDCYYLPEVSGELDADLGWHGSVKPVKVVADILSRICALTAIVYDGCIGSGTTLIAAEQTGRICYAIEILPANASIALARYEKLTGKTAVLIDNA